MDNNTIETDGSIMMARPKQSGSRTRGASKSTTKNDLRSGPLRNAAAYRRICRWHFYAGLICLPFITILSLSGAVYLFKPQIDAYLDSTYDQLHLSGEPKRLDEQAGAAIDAYPGARLTALELRNSPADAARVRLMTKDGDAMRVLVRPDTLEIITAEREKSRFTTLMHDIHGELLLGDAGAILVEMAAAWAIVMILTGLYLWWPAGRIGYAGVFYPRLQASGRIFLKDLHSVTGFWLSLFALFFLISALPWTKVWGASFKYLRGMGAASEIRQEWTTGPASALARRQEMFDVAGSLKNEKEHDDHVDHDAQKTLGNSKELKESHPVGFDKIAARVFPLSLAEPVLISPPTTKTPNWVARSDSQNRALRATLEFDPKTFQLVKQSGFADRPFVDRVIGIGISAHEGQLFGWPNQLMGLMTALGYLVLVVTSTLMWWRRRPDNSLGAPVDVLPRRRLAPALVGLIVVLGVLLPTLGVSLLATLAIEALIQRRYPALSRWLGLETHRHKAAGVTE